MWIQLVFVLLNDEGKRCAETLFMDYHNQNQVAIKIIRILTPMVPNMNPAMDVVSNLLSVLQGQDITDFYCRSLQYICRHWFSAVPSDGLEPEF
jgi:UDP-glucuronate decarboxylase